MSIVFINLPACTVTTAYAVGHEVPGLEVGVPRPLHGSLMEQVMSARSGVLIQGQDPDHLLRLAPGAARGIEAGLISVLMVSLISQDQVIGALVLRSIQANCYTKNHLKLAERIGVQIGGAIASAQLYANLAETEEPAQRERQRLESVLEIAPVGILVVDAEQKVLFANQEMERIIGFAHRLGDSLEWHMASVGVLRRPDGTEYEANEWPLQRALLGGEIVWAEEAQIELRDGPKVPVLANATPILAADGALVGGILTLQDMGALQQAQSARREFLGVVSHEMRNPLSIIKGAVASVLRFDRPIGPEEVRELFQIIDERADQLRELIDHLLDINLIESSTLLVELQPLDLKVVLERAQESFSRTSTTHHLVVKTPEHVPLVLGDRNRIEQVLLNLVHNAAKFSPDLTPITIEVESGPNEVTVHVRDQGIGIPPDQLPLLFQKFTRLHAEGPGQTEGIGLGLAICKGIIEAHRGRIWAESPGLGKISTFSFTLPVASELPQTLHPE